LSRTAELHRRFRSAVMKFQTRNTVLVDLHGATVVPGLIDSHCHLIGVGERELTLNLEGTTSLEDLLSKVRARVEQVPEGIWVTGRGWIESVWTQPIFPNSVRPRPNWTK
jgi:predicted amidohydrolase YtcJ